MAEKILISQTNFSGGQVDEDANRREDAKAAKAGGRIMSNWRPRNTGTMHVRPGRSAIARSTGPFYAIGPRAERFYMSPTQQLIIVFSAGRIDILDRNGNLIARSEGAGQTSGGPYPWTNATVGLINWTIAPDRIVICFPGMRPQVINWDFSTNTFSFAPFSFRVVNNQVRQPFMRTAILGATMGYSGVNSLTSDVGLNCSVPYFTNAMIGHSISIAGQQAVITGVGSETPVTTCAAAAPAALRNANYYNLKPSRDWNGNAYSVYPQHSLVEAANSKALMEVTAIPSNTQIVAVHFSPSVVNNDDYLVSEFGAAQITNGGFAGLPQPVVTWAHEFMGDLFGWPQACFYDHGRLGFCDFPQRPEAILWSAIGIYDMFWVDSTAAIANPTAGASAAAAILEFVDGKPHVRNVVGWNGDEFVFTDRGIYVIPIAAAGNPLKPGSVEFRFTSDAAASSIKPALTRDALVFTSASNSRVSAMIRTGNFTTPYVEMDLTEFHSSLVKTPKCITIGHGDDGFPERYVYVLNSDGSVALGKIENDKSFVGWQPWTGAGAVQWVSSFALDVLFTTNYGTQQILEYEDAGMFLDHAVNIAAPPANMLSTGVGPLIAFANGQVRVMDGAIDYGLRNVDSNGFLIPNPDDDFSSPTVVAGQAFTSIFSPFLEEAGRGQAQGQRQRRRKIARAIVAVYGSSGFTFGGRTIPPFGFGENPFAQPNLKETTYTARFIGRDFDPRVVLIKDTPGPLTVIEFAQEVTV
jgi:hypothetical protein